METVDKLRSMLEDDNLLIAQREAVADAIEVIEHLLRATASSLALNGCLCEMLSNRDSDVWSLLRASAIEKRKEDDDDDD